MPMCTLRPPLRLYYECTYPEPIRVEAGRWGWRRVSRGQLRPPRGIQGPLASPWDHHWTHRYRGACRACERSERYISQLFLNWYDLSEVGNIRGESRAHWHPLGTTTGHPVIGVLVGPVRDQRDIYTVSQLFLNWYDLSEVGNIRGESRAHWHSLGTTRHPIIGVLVGSIGEQREIYVIMYQIYEPSYGWITMVWTIWCMNYPMYELLQRQLLSEVWTIWFSIY